MRRATIWSALAAGLVAGTGSAAFAQPPALAPAPTSKPMLSGCRTAKGSIHFDFEGASRSTCYVEGERAFSILVTPEHQPPINPSPWYAFRYSAATGANLTVNVRYLGASHRYAPKWRGRGDPVSLSVTVAKDRSAVSITLPPGEGIVSGQPLMTAIHYDKLIRGLVDTGKGSRIVLGYSHGDRPVEAVRLGNAHAPQLVILLGRQHPPEVTGAVAMDAFTQTIARLVRSGAIDPRQFQFLIVPLVNPDGVARGHWRANLGGADLNRDWGKFKQPETRAVGDWLARLPAQVRPVLMLDFHSTDRNLFYVQGDETTAQGKRFLAAWLGGKETALTGFPFTIEQRDANPGSGSSKNWFNARYGIPAFTYEIGDETEVAAVRAAAETLAQSVLPALNGSQADAPRQSAE